MYIHSTYSSTVSKLLLYQRSRSVNVSSTAAWLLTVGWATSAVTTWLSSSWAFFKVAPTATWLPDAQRKPWREETCRQQPEIQSIQQPPPHHHIMDLEMPYMGTYRKTPTVDSLLSLGGRGCQNWTTLCGVPILIWIERSVDRVVAVVRMGTQMRVRGQGPPVRTWCRWWTKWTSTRACHMTHSWTYYIIP